MIKIYFYIFLLSVCLVACSPINKTQVTEATNFAQATKGISRMPADIYFRLYSLKAESQYLQVNSLISTSDDAAESIRLLKSDFEERQQFLELADQYASAYKIVETYASLLLSLLDEKYLQEFKKAEPTWQLSFDKMIKQYNNVSLTKISGSLSRFTAAVVQDIGRLSLKSLQKKYLKQALQEAHNPFLIICEDFIVLDSLKIAGELANLPAHLDNNYASFLENIRAYESKGNNPYNNYTAYSPIYTRWLSQVEEIKVISQRAVGGFRKLRDAYEPLQLFMEGTGERPVKEMEALVDQYEKIISTYNKFKNRQLKLSAVELIK